MRAWAARLAPALALAAVWWLVTNHGPTADVSVSDLYLYGVYADLMAHGGVPYDTFGFEYPPLALVPIVAARWLGGAGASGYADAFSALMLACAIAAQAAVAVIAGRRAAWLMVLIPLLLGALVRTHLDLLPTAMAMGGLALLVRRHPVWGLALLGAGAATKLFPALIALVAVAWLAGRGERRAAWRGALAAALAFVVVLVPFAGSGLGDTVAFHLERPVQIESSPATVLWALGGGHVTGTPAHPDRFKSNGRAGGAAGAVRAVFAVLLLAALAVITVLASRRPGPRDLVLLAFAALLAFVSLGSVLSPQYLVWLLPFAAIAWVWEARAPALLVAAAAALTQVWFPSRYFDLVDGDGGLAALVGARDLLLLIALTALVARAAGRARSPSPSGAPSTG